MSETHLKNVIEAALLAAGKPLQIPELAQLFEEHARPDNGAVRTALDALVADYEGRGIEVKETATGFRIQVRKELAPEVSRLWPERPPRYSRALLETLALIAYRQPITRAEIEAVRGVAVNPNIIKTLLERGWVRVVGTRDVPGRPELLSTTRDFLDYFSLKSLDELPPLAELKTMTDPNLQLALSGATPAAALAVDGLNDGAPAEATDGAAANAVETGAGNSVDPDADAAIAASTEAAASAETAEVHTEDQVADNVVPVDGEANADTISGEDATDDVREVEVALDDEGDASTDEQASDDEGDESVDELTSNDEADAVVDEHTLDDETDTSADERTLEGHNDDDEETETRQAQASDHIGFDDELTDDDDEDDSEGDSAELVAARRDYED
jgi:segregation and condensation protein B